jgi:hypothetical protein
MIERKLKAYGIKKVIPDEDVLGETYLAFHRSRELKKEFEAIVEDFEATEIKVPKNLKKQVAAILKKHPDLRWDDALKVVLDETQLERVREKKQKARERSGDFTDVNDDVGE